MDPFQNSSTFILLPNDAAVGKLLETVFQICFSISQEEEFSSFGYFPTEEVWEVFFYRVLVF